MPFFGGHHGHHGHHGGFRGQGASPQELRGGRNVGNTRDKATKEPQATGIDTLYPEDCGRDENNKGQLCFPDGLLCQNSKIREPQKN